MTRTIPVHSIPSWVEVSPVAQPLFLPSSPERAVSSFGDEPSIETISTKSPNTEAAVANPEGDLDIDVVGDLSAGVDLDEQPGDIEGLRAEEGMIGDDAVSDSELRRDETSSDDELIGAARPKITAFVRSLYLSPGTGRGTDRVDTVCHSQTEEFNSSGG